MAHYTSLPSDPARTRRATREIGRASEISGRPRSSLR